MTTLNDNTILVSGGQDGGRFTTSTNFAVYTSCEIFNITTGGFTPTSSMATARYAHRATLLPSGRLLVAGGYSLGTGNGQGATASAEIYDPKTSTWSPAASMPIDRVNFEMQALPSGLVFVGGGASGRNYVTDTLFYNENTDTWSPGTSLLFTNVYDNYRPTGVLYRS